MAEPVEVSATHLDDPSAVWTAGGETDVFAARLGDDGAHGPRRFLWTAPAGTALPGFALPGVVILAVPAPAAAGLTRRPATALTTDAAEALAAALLKVMRPAAPVTLDALLEPGAQTALLGDRLVGVRSALWLRQQSGRSTLYGMAHLEVARGAWLPLAPGAYLHTLEDGSVATGRAPEGDGLTHLGEIFARWLAATLAAEEKRDGARRRERGAYDASAQSGGLGRLARLLGRGSQPATGPAGGDPLLAACRAVGRASGIAFEAPPTWLEASSDRLEGICRVSRVQSRPVALRGEWWASDSGPLLGLREEGHAPVSLLPVKGGYDLVDPGTGTTTRVDAAIAARLEGFAISFYRPLPARALGVRDLLVGTLGLRKDIAHVAAAGLASAALGLVLPVATSRVVSEVIPAAHPSDLLMLLVSLVAVALGAALFDLTRSLALLRVEGWAGSTLQAALVARLLALPVPFFRRFSVGDLAQRASAVIAVQQQLGTAALGSMLVGMLSLVNLGLLFYYSRPLAVLALILGAAAAVLNLVLMGNSVRHARRSQDAQGRLAGLVLQLIGGVAKLRVAGAESRAFGVWCARFAEERGMALRAGAWREAARVLNDVLPVVATTLLFTVTGYLLFPDADAPPGAAAPTPLTTGDFVAFSMAFGAFFASGITLSNSWLSCLEALPLLERARPILETVPEGRADRSDPGVLTGRIEASHVFFRYFPGGPLVLEDVSFVVEPGQFVAFVGPSGSGKSSTLRLLLGFEQPEKGAVYLDGQDLASLDLSAVRSQQVGVVLQHSRLLAGDIFRNIVGHSGRTLEEAWVAAEKAGLADDIRAMPMGMYTILSDGAGTLSGGQRQRLLIARALVRRPRILLFDEATSAIDNRTQDTVTRTLELSQATRVVIAHRLSTIRKADLILVMDRGRIVQSGDYDALARVEGGLFARLVARQEAGPVVLG